jgi:holin-like protein
VPPPRSLAAAALVLVACQGAGALLARLAPLPIAGPVLGLLVAVALLLPRRDRLGALPAVADGLHRQLPLFFVPAGTAVVAWLPTLGRDWRPIAIALVVSTLVGVVVTALVMQRLATPTDDDRGGPTAAPPA